ADPAPTLPVWDIAVAPDDEDFLAVVTDDRQEVYISEDGGETWDCTHLDSSPGWDSNLLVSDVAVSLLYDGERDIAVGTRLPDGNVAGDVWVLQSQTLTTWDSQGLDMDVSAVEFSPDYAGDETIMVVASDLDDTYLCTGYRNTQDNTTVFEVTDPYFIELCELDEDSPSENELIFVDVAVPPGYTGDSATSRQLYISYTSTTDADDAYWIEDDEVHRLGVDRGNKIELYSIAYDSGTLFAGEVAAKADTGRARIHICDDPQAVYPDWYETEKKPSGGFGTGVANVIVTLTPDRQWGICGTSTTDITTPSDWADTTLPGPWSGNDAASPDESAISRASSGTEYQYWDQISLIDTDMEKLTDYVLWLVEETDEDDPANLIYLASVGSGADSIWRTRASHYEDLGQRWERVDYLDAPSDDILMRRTPDDSPDDAVFYAVRGSHLAYKSLDEGQSWELIRECPEITDFGVVSSERLYVLDDYELSIAQWTKIRQWYVWDWTHEIDTGLESGFSLTHYGNNFIFVGDDGAEGRIAFSRDGGETFELMEPLPEAGPVHMSVDEEFGRNRMLYAATEDSASPVLRWTIDGSLDWRSLSPPDIGFSSLANTANVLYGAFGEGVDRTLIPRAENVTTVDWDRLTVGLAAGVDFLSETLRTHVNDEVYLFAIDDRDYDFDAEEGCLWVYSDTFALPTPWPVNPATGEVLECDICDCEATPFCFEWKQLPKAEIYELWVAMDERFQHVLLEVPDIEPECCDAPGICYFEIPFSFGCGETYYWRVRATGTTEGETVHTRWSPSMRFLVAAGSTVERMHVAPLQDAPEPGAKGVTRTPGFSWTGFPSTTEYEFLLSETDSFEDPLVRERLARTAYVYPDELEWGETYFWRVRALKPHPSEWLTASFTVIPEPQPDQEPDPSPLQDLPAAAEPQDAPAWVWLVIGSLALLTCLVIVAAAMKRH
ncbi:MAG: hypothetical protein ACOC9B_05285, partial [Chloroflexota bacterium]